MVCCCRSSSPDLLPLLSAGAAFLSSGLTPGTWQSYRSCPSLPLPLLLLLLLLRPASPQPTPLLSPLLPLCLPCSSIPALTHYPGTQLTTGERWSFITHNTHFGFLMSIIAQLECGDIFLLAHVNIANVNLFQFDQKKRSYCSDLTTQRVSHGTFESHTLSLWPYRTLALSHCREFW